MGALAFGAAEHYILCLWSGCRMRVCYAFGQVVWRELVQVCFSMQSYRYLLSCCCCCLLLTYQTLSLHTFGVPVVCFVLLLGFAVAWWR